MERAEVERTIERKLREEYGLLEFHRIRGELPVDRVSGLSGGVSPHTHDQADITDLVTDLADLATDIAGKSNVGHGHAQGDITSLVSDLAGKQPLDSDLTAIAALSTTAHGRAYLAAADAAAVRTLAGAEVAGAAAAAQAASQPLDSDLTAIAALSTTAYGRAFLAMADAAAAKTALSLVKGDVGLGNVDNVQQQPLDSDLTAIAALSTTATGRSLLAAADAAAIRTIASAASSASVPNASYRTLLDSSGSHVAARVAGTYGFAQSQPLAISGTGTLYPLNTIYIDDADYPTLDGVAPKLRVRAQLYVNDVAPTGNFTVALHPITRPASSGGAGVLIYTIGAAVASSGVTVNTPAADSSNQLVGSDFALPADGHYVLGLVTTATVAASSLVHISAKLQMRNA